MKDYVERFWDHVKRGGPDECWIWNGGPILPKLDATYGHLKVNGKYVGTHRVSWMIHNGRIPDGKFVLHRCDHKQCVNPAHLYLGNQKDNVNDFYTQNPNYIKDLKARRDSEAGPLSLLSEFRHEAGLTQVKLEELSGVSYRTIQDQEAGVFRYPNLKTARRITEALSKELGREITIDDVWPE